MQYGLAFGTECDRRVLRKLPIHAGRHFRQLPLQLLDELVCTGRQAYPVTKFLQPALALWPGQQFRPMIGEGLGSGHEYITGLQVVGQVGQHANLELAAVDQCWVHRVLQQSPPTFTGEA